jgi:ribosome biogenesis protein BMS1
MKEVTAIPDPCPLPSKVKRKLNEQDKVIYAPMSDVGNIFFDKDAIYINIPDQLMKEQGYQTHITCLTN